MYTIIGGDGREYGPVSAEQVRSWMAGGRANLDTKVKAIGTDEWKRIADFPEITGGVASAGAAAAYAPALNPHSPKLDIISCYERSWALLKSDFWPLVGVSFLMVVIYSVLEAIGRSTYIYLSPLLGGAINAGWFYYYLRKARGLPTSLGDAFAGFSKALVALILIRVIVTAFVVVGMICLVLPGIYLLVAYTFACLAALDKGLGFWAAMETSRRVVTSQWWRVLGLLLLSLPFLLLGVAALGVGVFVAIPLIVGAYAYAYDDLFSPGA
jgi:hypothetical protein